MTQEIMRKVPEGYRVATLEERILLIEAAGEVALLEARLGKIKADEQTTIANLNIIRRDARELSEALLLARKNLEETRVSTGVDPKDENGVIIDRGVTYIRKPVEKGDSLPAGT